MTEFTATNDIEQADHDLAELGACVIKDVLAGDALKEVQEALYRVARREDEQGWRQKYQYGADDGINQRVWNLVSRDTLFCSLVEHPLALRFVRSVIGWPALLSSISANITGPGGGSMVVHADQGYMPMPWARPQAVNIGWCIDDFTVENGATRVALGSHKLNRQPTAEDARGELTPILATAGSMIVMEGRVWHTNGVNTGNGRRAGIFAAYTLPIYLPQENWFLSLNPVIRQYGSETLQTLFGFRPQVFGRINGLDHL